MKNFSIFISLLILLTTAPIAARTRAYLKNSSFTKSDRVVFSPDGKTMVVTGTMNKAGICAWFWDIQKRKVTVKKRVSAVQFRKSNMPWLEIWDSKYNKFIITPTGKRYPLLRNFQLLNVSPDETFYVGRVKEKLYIKKINGKTIARVKLPFHGLISKIQISNDSKRIAFKTMLNNILIYNRRGKLLKKIARRGFEPTRVKLHPDGSIFAGSRDNRVYRFSINGKLLHVYKAQARDISSMAISPDGKYMAVTSADEGSGSSEPAEPGRYKWDTSLKIWDTNGTLLNDLEKNAVEIYGFGFHPQKTHILATLIRHEYIRIWNIKTSKYLQLYVNPEGDWLVRNEKGIFDSNPGKNNAVYFSKNLKILNKKNAWNSLRKEGLFQQFINEKNP